MQITDGTTTLTFTDSEENFNDFDIEKTRKMTAGGDWKSIVAGERFDIKSRFRTTPENLRLLKDLLNNGSSNYWFTPTVDWSSDLFPDITFPLRVDITKIKIEWHNGSYYYVTMDVESVSYV